MEVPSRNRHVMRQHELPSIYGDSSMRNLSTNQHIKLPPISTAMSIPGARDVVDAPPPLPPPRNILEAPNHIPQPPPSNYGSLDDERPNYQSRQDRDEGYSSLPSPSASQWSAPNFGLSHQHFYQLNHDYDRSLKNKLDIRGPLDARSSSRRAGLSASLSDLSGRPSQIVGGPLSLPIHPGRPNAHESVPISAASPRSTPYYPDHRSSNDMMDPERSPYRIRRNNSGPIPEDTLSVSTPGTVADELDFPNEETKGMRQLRLEDSFGRPSGIKRRASSPPSDEPPVPNMGAEILRRQNPPSRGSPTPRLSIPSTRAGSFPSLSAAPTTMAAYNRRSPVGISPSSLSPIASDPGMVSTYTTPIPVTTTRAPILRNTHQRNMSESRHVASPRKITEGKPGVGRLQGFFMCDCCPKKPKKFETREELRVHEAEKQYECSFCGNRFKNKNEAERHQNSLHVRRHSWSCAALVNYDRAFHESTSQPGETDTCGYCGKEFTRSGGSGRLRHATEADWDERIRHITEIHKFRECNSSKKFYRADHFRQHLKHSHAGLSGKWTNMLENACMLDEEPPTTR